MNAGDYVVVLEGRFAGCEGELIDVDGDQFSLYLNGGILIYVYEDAIKKIRRPRSHRVKFNDS